jgi:hypothetical protein
VTNANGSQVSTLSVPSGSCTLAWGALNNITGSGGATFTATNSFNVGTNAGWSITPPADATVAVPTVAQIATAVWQDATAGDFTTAGSIGKDLKTGAAPGAANGHFIAGTNAATTITTSFTATFTGNLTGSVASVTGAVGSVTAGVTVTTNSDKTGYSLTQAFPTNFSSLGISAGGHITLVDTLTTYTGNTPQTGDNFARIGAAGAGLTALGDTRIANLDATVSSRMATFVYTAPDNTDIAAIKVQTDKLAFTTANQVDANIHSVNNVTVNGVGTSGSPWGP